MDLSDWIKRQADIRPDKPALIYEGLEISYASLAQLIDRYAQLLGAGMGIGPGDRVAYLGLNSPELLALLFASARLGAIFLPLNWRLTSGEHVRLLQHAKPAVLMVESEFTAHIDGVREQLEPVRLVRLGDSAGGWDTFDNIDRASQAKPPIILSQALSDSDGVLLCYTSGTTGTPKGALLSKNALYWNALNSTHMHDLSSEDVILTVLPMFHVGGLNIQTLPALHAGATVILQRSFDMDQFFETLNDGQITLSLLVPTAMLAIMADPRWANAKPGKLRIIGVGSTMVPTHLVNAVGQWGVPLMQVYGATETAPIAAYSAPADAARKPTSTGKPAIHCELKIVDSDGNELGAGERGEILVRGPNVIKKYWNDSAATDRAFSGQWFHTGDIGHFDEEGYLYVDGHLKDVIISGGENIYPAQIENLISERPDIAEVAVVGQADDYWGEVAVAVVVAEDGYRMDSTEITANIMGWCLENMAHYSCPREVVVMDQLPRNAMGKVLKEELRELIALKGKTEQARRVSA